MRALVLLPVAAFAAWFLASSVSTQSRAAIASLLDAPGLEFGAPVASALRALGHEALYGPTCGGRTAVTTDVRVAGTDWHIMVMTQSERVTAVELVSKGSRKEAACTAHIAALERMLDEHDASRSRDGPVERRHGFVTSTTTRYTLADGTHAALDHRRWLDDGSCDLAVRFTRGS